MRKVVLLNDLDATDIISNSLYKEYTNLLEKDIAYFFDKKASLLNVECPGCGSSEISKQYTRMGMDFKICSQCSSHYVSPRPTPEMLENFYRDSLACNYWRKETLGLPESKIYYIYGPRVNWILELVDELLPNPGLFLDVETKYPYLLKHLQEQRIFNSILTFRPQIYELNKLLPEGVVIKDNFSSYTGAISIIAAFETLERMFDPRQFFVLANKCCQKGGLLLITTATCSGFEYQILGENAPNINPINRINLLSIEGLTKCIELAGFEIIELSTPGRLDVEIVRHAFKESEDSQASGFWKYIFEFRDEQMWQNLQNFLQVNRLSSHARIAARKK